MTENTHSVVLFNPVHGERIERDNVTESSTEWGDQNTVTLHYSADADGPSTESFTGPGLTIESTHDEDDTTSWETDADGFAEAVEADEYAELRLSTGDVLITDHEGDGTFNPYVEMTGDHGDAHPTDILDSVASAIEDATGAHVHAIEYDTNNDVLVPDMDRPDTDA